MTDREHQPVPSGDSQALGRVLDPEQLERVTSGRAKYALHVPAEWLTSGGQFEFVVPRLLPCSQCAGGGCDDCERSGALRGPSRSSARTIKFSIPQNQSAPFALRIAEPFGNAGEVRQLVLAITPGQSSEGLQRLSTGESREVALSKPPLAWPKLPWVAIAIIVLVLLIAAGAIMER